jgi:hypothetical protein
VCSNSLGFSYLDFGHSGRYRIPTDRACETLAERTSALAGEHLRRRQQRETLADAAILRFYAVEANCVSIRSQCWGEIITCSPPGVDLT